MLNLCQNCHQIRQGSVMIITGASSGLGKQLALTYCKRKLKLVITGRDINRLNQTKKQCQKIGNSDVTLFVGDITNPQTCKDLVAQTIKKYKRIDTLILNAGINSHFQFKQLKNTQVFHRLMNTNFFANVNLTQAALPQIKKSKGKIIVISSLSGKFGLPSRTAYCASKFALNGFFESLRTEQQTLDIILVFPTSLQTPMRNNNIKVNDKKTIQSHTQNNQKRQDPKKCAQYIMQKVDQGSKDIYIPIKGLIGVILQPIFPNFIRQKLKKSAKL